ncbi:MAG TPA: hypothetical protein VMZ91_09530 [Candidatus Paceibacterota bacterium]|nr:hypothetical protein [Candidatus Paceibacterota bacterium]
MSGLETITSLANNTSNFDTGKIVDYALFAGAAVCLGLLMHYVPIWRKKWRISDEEKERREREEKNPVDAYLDPDSH